MNILRSSSDRRPAGLSSTGSDRLVADSGISSDRCDRQVRQNCSRPAAGVRHRSSNGGGGSVVCGCWAALDDARRRGIPTAVLESSDQGRSDKGRSDQGRSDQGRHTRLGFNACRRFVEFTKGPGLTHFPVAWVLRPRARSGYKRASCAPHHLCRSNPGAGCRVKRPWQPASLRDRQASGESCSAASQTCNCPVLR